MGKPLNYSTPTKIELIAQGYSFAEINKIIKGKNKKKNIK